MAARPLKPAMPVAQQIALLRERGMTIDEGLARQWFANVSYYRLSAYWHPARRLNGRGERSDTFIDGTTFSDVAALYEADRKLRTLMHDGMERIEITMRTRIAELLCIDDVLAYTDPGRFRDTFKHTEWMGTAHRRIERSKRHNEAIRHYHDNYDSQYPFWVLAEVLDFSDMSRLFQGLPTKDQRNITEGLGITIDLNSLSRNQQRKTKNKSPLTRWLEQLTIVRNTCAHHGRLWNRSFMPAPTGALRTQQAFASLPKGQSERIFGAATVMAFILREASPGTSWPEKVTALINEDLLPNPLTSPQSIGIPEDWNGRL